MINMIGIYIGDNGGGSSDTWILRTGFWDDSGFWDDTKTWID